MRIHEDYLYARVQPCFLDKQDIYLIDDFYCNFPSMGNMGILLDRSPSFFNAIKVEGHLNEIIGVFDQETKKLAGAAVISLRKVFFNGEISTIGYISSLRIKPKYRGTEVFDLMYLQLYQFSHQHNVYMFLISVYESNKRIRSSISHFRKNRTLFQPIGKFYTAILSSFKNSDKHEKNNLSITKMREDEFESLIDFLNGSQSPQILSQHYRIEDFLNDQGMFNPLERENIFIARDNDRIVGSIAAWDQTSFRKWRVTHYSHGLKLARPMINIWQKLLGKPSFPTLNSTIPYKSVSLFRADSNQIAIKLLNKVIPSRATKTKYAIGLYQDSSLIPVLKKSSIMLESILLFSYWPECQRIIKNTKLKKINLEIGTL